MALNRNFLLKLGGAIAVGISLLLTLFSPYPFYLIAIPLLAALITIIISIFSSITHKFKSKEAAIRQAFTADNGRDAYSFGYPSLDSIPRDCLDHETFIRWKDNLEFWGIFILKDFQITYLLLKSEVEDEDTNPCMDKIQIEYRHQTQHRMHSDRKINPRPTMYEAKQYMRDSPEYKNLMHRFRQILPQTTPQPQVQPSYA